MLRWGEESETREEGSRDGGGNVKGWSSLTCIHCALRAQAAATRPAGISADKWLYDLALFADLRSAGAPSLPPGVAEMHKQTVRGKYVLQVCATRPPPRPPMPWHVNLTRV
jgi:hypothetical protein